MTRPYIEAKGDLHGRISDADALVAVLAWERCQELAMRARDEVIRDCWQRDADAAWKSVERWLEQENK